MAWLRLILLPSLCPSATYMYCHFYQPGPGLFSATQSVLEYGCHLCQALPHLPRTAEVLLTPVLSFAYRVFLPHLPRSTKVLLSPNTKLYLLGIWVFLYHICQELLKYCCHLCQALPIGYFYLIWTCTDVLGVPYEFYDQVRRNNSAATSAKWWKNKIAGCCCATFVIALVSPYVTGWPDKRQP